MAGYRVKNMKKSREGRKKKTCRPWRDFGRWRAWNPSHEWLGYFQGQWRMPKTATGTGARPGKNPAKGSLGKTNDEKGV